MVERASNSVGYFLPPHLGGFYGQVMYALPFAPGATFQAKTSRGYDLGIRHAF